MKFRPSLLIVLVLFTGISSLHSQDVNSFYFMRGVPQIYQVNPAFQPGCNFFLGLPGASPLKLRLSNSSVDLGDLVQYSSNIDSIVSFLHPDGIGGEAFLDRLDANNSFISEASISLASFGFRREDTYITFDIRERFSMHIDYSDDYFRFPIVGPDDGEFFDMDLGFDMSLINEFSLGVSQKINEQLTVGVRGKLLFGQANVHTDKFNMQLSTSEDVWTVNNDISLNTSAPYLIDYIEFAASAPIDAITGDVENFDLDPPGAGEILSLVINPRNFGMALDIGADYRLYDWLQLSASIVDFGSVLWSDRMINFSHEADYEYEGIEFYLSEANYFEDDFLDSLENTFNNFTATETEYRKYLPTKIYLGGAFYPHPKISLGLLSRTDIYRGDLRQQFTASANFYPIDMFNATLSYSIINNSYKNIGLGLGMRIFPLNLYLLTDTGPSVYFFPLEAKYFNFKIGLNIVIGCRKEKKFDMPLID